MAYLQADIDEQLYMKLDKSSSELLIKVRPDFSQFLYKGTILVKLKKAIYGLVQLAKLWYERFKKILYSIDFECNPVDVCVFNRNSKIDGSQLAIALHVDDGFVSCSNIDEIELLFKQLRDEFDVTVHDGPVLEYLGMQIDISANTAHLTMKNYTCRTSAKSGFVSNFTSGIESIKKSSGVLSWAQTSVSEVPISIDVFAFVKILCW